MEKIGCKENWDTCSLLQSKRSCFQNEIGTNFNLTFYYICTHFHFSFIHVWESGHLLKKTSQKEIGTNITITFFILFFCRCFFSYSFFSIRYATLKQIFLTHSVQKFPFECTMNKKHFIHSNLIPSSNNKIASANDSFEATTSDFQWNSRWSFNKSTERVGAMKIETLKCIDNIGTCYHPYKLISSANNFLITEMLFPSERNDSMQVGTGLTLSWWWWRTPPAKP